MAIIVNLTIGELLFEFMLSSFKSIIIFLVMIAIIKWYARIREWDNSTRTASRVSLLWLVIDLPLKFFFLYFLGPSIIFDPLRIVIEVVIISLVVEEYYYKKFKEALIFLLIIQALLYIILMDISIFIDAYFFMTAGADERLVTSGDWFYFCLLVLLGINIFYVNWGDKMQFVKNKNLIILFTTTPGFIFLADRFYTQGDQFLPNFAMNLVYSAVLTIVISTIAKIIATRMIDFHEYRDVTFLEKGELLLDVNQLKVYYPLIGGVLKRQFGSVKAVNGVTFSIKNGETVGLVGESGCGKTTVANAILGLVPKEAGEILFHGEPIPDDYQKILRQKIQIVFQDPDASLNPRMKIVDIIAEPLKNLLGITKKDDLRKRVLKLLKEVSLEREHMDRFPHEFSGGQKQRIIIARALASNPELIILDEPTSALDVSVQAQILNLLKGLQKSYGYGFLFITHNLSVVNHIADRVAVMYLGKFVEIGDTDQIFLTPTHPYTQALLASRSEIDPTNKEISFVIKGEVPSPIAPPPGCTFNPRCISDAKTKECMREMPHAIKIEEGHYIWCVNPPLSMQTEISVGQKNSDILEN
ncbi:MAG: ABC transporter ATP-binding protein [Promethearchaeota archaeon]|jgi:oligopeptide/dipeptide ABC transporter ATP-binding protein